MLKKKEIGALFIDFQDFFFFSFLSIKFSEHDISRTELKFLDSEMQRPSRRALTLIQTRGTLQRHVQLLKWGVLHTAVESTDNSFCLVILWSHNTTIEFNWGYLLDYFLAGQSNFLESRCHQEAARQPAENSSKVPRKLGLVCLHTTET